MRTIITRGDSEKKTLVFHLAKVQYKSLKVDRNGGKSKKSKTIFVASPVEAFIKSHFPNKEKVISPLPSNRQFF